MKGHGLIIAKPGFDARTADVKDQIFNSHHNSLKIWMTGNAAITVPSGDFQTASIDVAHGLGYSPFYLVYFKLVNSNKLWLQSSLDTEDISDFVSGSAYANATNLHMSVTVNQAGYPGLSATAYYIILIDKAYE